MLARSALLTTLLWLIDIRSTAAQTITARQAPGALLHDGPAGTPTSVADGCSTIQDRGSGDFLTLCPPGHTASAGGFIPVPIIILPPPEGLPPTDPETGNPCKRDELGRRACNYPEDNQPTDLPDLPEPTGTQTVSHSATSTSTALREGPTALCLIRSNWGTNKTDFDGYVKQLDGGSGTAISKDGVPFQAYQTFLNQSQVEDVRKQPWLASVKIIQDLGADEDASEANRAITSPTTSTPVSDVDHDDNHLRKRGTRAKSAAHLKLISADPANSNVYIQQYTYDDSLGKGSTIFIVDNGFDLGAADLQNTADRTVSDYVVDPKLTIPYQWQAWDDYQNGRRPVQPQQSPYPKRQSDEGGQTTKSQPDGSVKLITNPGHGTGVASAAAGLTYGVASKADLFLIKAKGSWRFQPNIPDGQDPSINPARDQVGLYTESAIFDAITEIIAQVESQKLQGKAVVNLSWGLEDIEGRQIHEGSFLFDVFVNFIKFCKDNGVVLVIAAGNDGPGKLEGFKRNMGATLPQRLGISDRDSDMNQMITVGGVINTGSINTGKLWDTTTPAGKADPALKGDPEGAGNKFTGAINVYAQGKDVRVDTSAGPGNFESGTSFASPQVAGLAAYFIQHPPGGHPFADVAKETKWAIEDNAVAWMNNAPDVKSANNGARGSNTNLCGNTANKRDGSDSCHQDPPQSSPDPPPPPPPPPSPPPSDVDPSTTCRGYPATGNGQPDGARISCPPAAYQWQMHLPNFGNQHSSNNTDTCAQKFLGALRSQCGAISSWTCNESGDGGKNSEVFFGTTIFCSADNVQTAFWNAYHVGSLACRRDGC